MKSGLTANLDITTQTKNGRLDPAAVRHPPKRQRHLRGNARKTAPSSRIPVTLGIEDQNGNVEIASGTTEGEQVINVGLK